MKSINRFLSQPQNEKHILSIIFHLFFVVYIIFSIFYYQERLFSDSAVYFFRIVNFEEFNFPHGRYSSIITSIPTWIAIKLNVNNLNLLAVIFSISYSIFYYFIFIILHNYIKNQSLALAYILFVILSVSHTFFWMVSEYSQAIALSFVLYGLLSSEGDHYKKPVFITLTIVVIFYFHFLATGLILFIYLLFYFQNNKIKMESHLPLIILGFLLLIKFLTFDKYESGNVSKEINVINYQVILRILEYLFNNYLGLIIVFIITIVTHIISKKLKVLLFLIFSILFYLLLVNLFFDAYWDNFYYENLYLPLGFMVLVSFEMYFKDIKKANFYLILIILIVIFQLYFYDLTIESKFYSNRLKIMKNYSEEFFEIGNKMMVLKPENDFKQVRIWSLPIESLIISSIYDKSVTMITEEDYNNYIEYNELNQDEIIIVPWEEIDISQFKKNKISSNELNQKLFKLNGSLIYQHE